MLEGILSGIVIAICWLGGCYFFCYMADMFFRN